MYISLKMKKTKEINDIIKCNPFQKNDKKKEIKNLIIRKIRRKMKQGLNKLNEQHKRLVTIFNNLNNLKIQNNIEFKKISNKISKEIKYANEENNDDIAILKMEKDLIKADFTKNKKSLKIYNEHEEEFIENEESKKRVKHEKKKKKKRKNNNSHSSQNFANSVTPLQIFHDNCICMNSKCDHNDFTSDNLKVKNSVVLDLFNALSKNKYYKETNLCENILDDEDIDKIYAKEKKKLKKKRKLINFLIKKKKKRKNERIKKKKEKNIKELKSYLNNENTKKSNIISNKEENVSNTCESALHKNVNSDSKILNDSNLYNSSNTINENKNKIYWIYMKKQINKSVNKNNLRNMISNVLTFFCSISKIFYCEVIDKKRDKYISNDDFKCDRIEKFYDYILADEYDIMNNNDTIDETKGKYKNDSNINAEKKNYIYIYIKKNFFPKYLLNLKKKIKLILIFSSNDVNNFNYNNDSNDNDINLNGNCHGVNNCKFDNYLNNNNNNKGNNETQNNIKEDIMKNSIDKNYINFNQSNLLNKKGFNSNSYLDFLFKYNKFLNKNNTKKMNIISRHITLDDNLYYNLLYLNYLLKMDKNEKERYDYFYIHEIKYDNLKYDIENIKLNLEKIMTSKKKNKISKPFLLLNYMNKNYSLNIRSDKKGNYKYNGKIKKRKFYKISKNNESEYINNHKNIINSNDDENLKGNKKRKTNEKSIHNKEESEYVKNHENRKNYIKRRNYKNGKNSYSFFDEVLSFKGLENNLNKNEEVEIHYLTIYKHMLSFNDNDDEITLKYYMSHIQNSEFSIEFKNEHIPVNILHFFNYYIERKNQLEETIKEHTNIYKQIYKLWKEDIDISEKEKEKKNIFAWGILPVRAYDHPYIFVPLPCGFKYNNKNLAYYTSNDKKLYDDNLLEKKEKKKEYMNIKYANLIGPCINWRKNCIFVSDLKKKKFLHISEYYPYFYCMQNIKLSLFSLERNVIYENTNNMCNFKDYDNLTDNINYFNSISSYANKKNSKILCTNNINNSNENNNNNIKKENNFFKNKCSKKGSGLKYTKHILEENMLYKFYSNEELSNEKNYIWNKQEIRIFLEKYLLYPKKFDKISQFLEFKNTKQCVDFYYLTKNFFCLKKLLLTISENKGKRNKKCSVNDINKKNPKEEIVNKLIKKLENNYIRSEFEDINCINYSYINIKNFFKNYFVKTYKGSSYSKNLTNKINNNKNSSYNNYTNKGVILENMSDGYVIPKNYNFILSSNRKLCFLVKNNENFIYSGINSDIIEIKYNENLDSNKKKEGKKKKKSILSYTKKIKDYNNNVSNITIEKNYNKNEYSELCNLKATSLFDKNDDQIKKLKRIDELSSCEDFKNKNILKNINNESVDIKQTYINSELRNIPLENTVKEKKDNTDNYDANNNIINGDYKKKLKNKNFLSENDLDENCDDKRINNNELSSNEVSNNFYNSSLNLNSHEKKTENSTCEESLFKCFEFLKNMNQKNNENFNKNSYQNPKSTSFSFDYKYKKCVKKNIFQKKSTVLEKEKNVKKKNQIIKAKNMSSLINEKGKNIKKSKKSSQKIGEKNTLIDQKNNVSNSSKGKGKEIKKSLEKKCENEIIHKKEKINELQKHENDFNESEENEFEEVEEEEEAEEAEEEEERDDSEEDIQKEKEDYDADDDNDDDDAHDDNDDDDAHDDYDDDDDDDTDTDNKEETENENRENGDEIYFEEEQDENEDKGEAGDEQIEEEKMGYYKNDQKKNIFNENRKENFDGELIYNTKKETLNYKKDQQILRKHCYNKDGKSISSLNKHDKFLNENNLTSKIYSEEDIDKKKKYITSNENNFLNNQNIWSDNNSPTEINKNKMNGNYITSLSDQINTNNINTDIKDEIKSFINNKSHIELLDEMKQIKKSQIENFDSSKQFRKTATKWTDKEKKIYFEIFLKDGKNWDSLYSALKPYGKTKEQVKNFYQNTIAKKRKKEFGDKSKNL
ncbi:conserved Plasmodium protein, unknown function [Plasmodium gallinaceum]|uniref:SANT domain-containing protein n=1 Tax=Plasmodium gallinaceum TaxID=5849 RepID=A0A1J1GVK4_PLAGA|nr:conserved Plasmodium protein, unknown function [Plasmodium gallinaceum]CRG96278.1 conserved Plasmodium protein, unknown function [Plasmodium gallinaceum]